MKLKTLKDLREGRAPRGELIGSACGNFVEAQYMAEERLKQEAIKWVKRHQIMAMKTDSVEDWIKHFFNITEEDLK